MDFTFVQLTLDILSQQWHGSAQKELTSKACDLTTDMAHDNILVICRTERP